MVGPLVLIISQIKKGGASHHPTKLCFFPLGAGHVQLTFDYFGDARWDRPFNLLFSIYYLLFFKTGGKDFDAEYKK